MRWTSTQLFPKPISVSCCFYPQNPGITRHERYKTMLPRRILAEFCCCCFFLVLQQQENINAMICWLMLMPNLWAQSLPPIICKHVRARQTRINPFFADIVKTVAFRTENICHRDSWCCVKSIAWRLCYISPVKSKHPRFCFPRFVSVWPAPE